MKKGTAPLLVFTVGLSLLANAHAQEPKPVLITNASFESPSVDEGSFSAGVPGWSWTGSPDITVHAVVHPGGSSSREPWPTTPPFGIDGSNFCKLYASSNLGTGVLWQDTGIKYQAGATYTLTAAFGLQADQMFSAGSTMFLCNSSLTPFGCLTIAEANLTAGEFKDQSVTYTATGSEAPGDGSYGTAGDVIIGFWLPPSSPAGSYLDFDNVRLKAPPRARRPATTPAPAAIHSPAMAPTPATTPSYFGNHA